MVVKTLVLTSRNRVSGTHGDCYVEIGNRLLESHKKYTCKVKWVHLAQPTTTTNMRAMFMTIDGLYPDDIYHNTATNLTPFVVVDTSLWSTTVHDMLFEPRDHLRVVRVNQNVLRVRFYDAEQNLDAAALITGWMMELQFVEIEE